MSDPVVLGIVSVPDWLASSPGQEENGVYDLIKPALPPYDHQKRAVNNAVKGIMDAGFHALFMEMGTGKTKTTIDSWMVLVGKRVSTCLVVICPKSLISTWVEEEIPKHLTIEAQVLAWDGKSSIKSNAAFEAFIGSGQPLIYVVNVEAFQTLNDTLRVRMSTLLRSRAVVMAVDECFAPGTLVDLMVEDKPLTLSIKRVRIEDVRVGDIVANAIGGGIVMSTHQREVFGAVIVSYGGKEITCSHNHLFFTTDGWISARNLRSGDYLSTTESAMRLVRGDLHSGTSGPRWTDPDVLQSVLLGEMAQVSARNQSPNHTGDKEVLYRPSRAGCQTSKANCRAEPDEKSRVSGEMLGNAQGNEASAENPWWKWTGLNIAAVQTLVDTRQGMGSRSADSDKSIQRSGIPHVLQDRHSQQEYDGCHRSGWPQPLLTASPGPQEGCASEFVRVDSVEVLEQTDTRLDQFRDAEGRLYFHDLGISGHPSFSVNGVAVHNSSTIKGADAKRSKNIKAAGKLAIGKLILTGTEISKGPLDLYMQFEFLKDKFWGVRSFFMFKSIYAEMVDAYGPGGRTFKKIVGYRKVNELIDQIAPYTTRAMKKDCLDLPAKIRTTIKVKFTDAQKKVYDDLKAFMATILDSGEVMTIQNKISLFTKFRQITGGTMKNGEECVVIEPHPGKLTALIDDIQDTDEQAIIWCAFRGEVELVAKALYPYGNVVTFDGSTHIDDRSASKVFFQQGDARFFVANMKAGAFGLNLQNCHLQYFYSRDTSPQANWQAEDRSHRPGQKHPCVYKSLVVAGSVDERIEQLIGQSADLLDLLRSGNNGSIMDLI